MSDPQRNRRIRNIVVSGALLAGATVATVQVGECEPPDEIPACASGVLTIDANGTVTERIAVWTPSQYDFAECQAWLAERGGVVSIPNRAACIATLTAAIQLSGYDPNALRSKQHDVLHGDPPVVWVCTPEEIRTGWCEGGVCRIGKEFSGRVVEDSNSGAMVVERGE